MPQWYVGLIFLAGIFAASRRAGAPACVGSVVGTGTAWALGAPAEQVAEGTMGYHAVLVAMALCGGFLAVRAGPAGLPGGGTGVLPAAPGPGPTRRPRRF
ncbi:urea transporter [Streptomyces sp. NPDC001739]